MLLAVSVSVVAVLPAFLVGALALQIRPDLGIGLAVIGMATGVMFGISGLSARPLGALVQRLGARRGMALSALLSTVALAGCGVAGSTTWLMGALFVAGLSNGAGHPAANMALSEVITEARLGLAFGIKQAAIPAATLISGLAVPAVTLLVGWRAAFGLAAVLSAGIAVWALFSGRDSRTRKAARTGVPRLGVPRRALLILALGGGLGLGAATSLGVFLVGSGVEAGLDPAMAGLLFSAASLFGILVRVGLGWLADRRPHVSLYLPVAVLLLGGTLGYLFISAEIVPSLVVGSFIAFATGWAWPGLFQLAVVKDNRLAAASATGYVQTGTSSGCALVPLMFGFVAEAASYSTAWAVVAGLSAAAAVTVFVGGRMARGSRQELPMPPGARDDASGAAGAETVLLCSPADHDRTGCDAPKAPRRGRGRRTDHHEKPSGG
ncbi:MFS transporter [Blastococcus saxobsidens]|uniref:MFS transporter n=1 Tax=Blastococcus saxobsidens TaxID=138336 RepID=UPI001E384844|nr:MFS transporter [Blastococcus saxobsidens]